MQSIQSVRSVYDLDNVHSIQQGALEFCVDSTPDALRRRKSNNAESYRSPAENQTALLLTTNRKYQISTRFPIPQALGQDEVLIRTKAVGLNHIDWKSVDYNFCLPTLPWITGREMAGVVERVGAGVRDVQVGQRVWTSTYYKDRRAGCFQEVVVVPRHTVFEIPCNLDYHAAACLGVPALTAAMTLWRWLDVPIPAKNNRSKPPCQTFRTIAALAGIETIAVCSERTKALVLDLGATHCVTYTGKTNTELVAEVSSVCQGRLRNAIDLVGPTTASTVLSIIKACGEHHIVNFAPLGFLAKDQVLPVNARLQDVQMKQFVLDRTAKVYGERLNELLEARILRLPQIRVLKGGLWAVEKGLEMVKNGNLGGEKLVVSFA